MRPRGSPRRLRALASSRSGRIRFDKPWLSRITRLMAAGANPENWTVQDAQRDASSELASVTMRIRPDSLKDLYEINSLRALAAVVGTWAMIIATIALALWSHSAIGWILAIPVIARCQHALMVLAHDAAHFRLLENRFWNDFVGHWICFWPVGASLAAYRNVHLR